MNYLLQAYNDKTGQHEYVLNADDVVVYLGITLAELRSLHARSRNPHYCLNNFPAPTKILSRNHWFLGDIREWQVNNAQIWQRYTGYHSALNVIRDFLDKRVPNKVVLNECLDAIEKQLREAMLSQDAK